MFSVTYHITCYQGESIEEKSRWICLEQSVELPLKVIPDYILKAIPGKIQQINPITDVKWEVEIAWPLENIGDDSTQFLNVLYGNISLKRGIKVVHVEWEPLASLFNGPSFGITGVREKFNISDRPMACAVLKPMGFSAGQLAERATQFSAGGIDFIKDDHGLANQSYAPFDDRVRMVVEALKDSKARDGYRAAYFPNITVSASRLQERYNQAAELGADGVMVLPDLCGYEAMQELAASPVELPIIAHPSFSGTFVTDPAHGFTPAFLYGELYRAFGADCTVYPNAGGRFSFSLDNCKKLNEAARNRTSPFKPMLPMPGGGMKRETIPHWMKVYGKDTIFLMGASLLQHPTGIRRASEEVRRILESG
ncbi:MAG: ribulose 1,5-bisphosphate carboxylase [Balneolaceae bacterium]|nr:ribulose 1,5-bisphosphate carboxylase [Balneolaceae bacterium]